jgi:hypothetical protein
VYQQGSIARGLERRHMFKKLSPLLRGFLVISALIVIAFLWWTVSPLFINERVFTEVTDEGLQPQTFTTLLEGSFQSADDFHQVSGTVRVIDRGDDRIVRLEDDFNSINGPDLRVWLVKGDDRETYLDLGALEGNIGSQNYLLPEGTDLSQYDRVIVWCRAFRTLFGSATLLPPLGNSAQ